MAKRITNTIFSIPKLNGQDYYNIRVMVDIKHLNLDKIKVYQFKGKNKASPYYSIVVPAKWILNRNEEKRNEPLMVTPTKEVLDYNLNEILKKYVKHYTDVGFDKQSQDYVEYAKSPHQDFTKNQIKWINEVNDKLSSLNVLDFSNIKVGCALMSWDMKAGSRTLGCALIKENIVLFNQNHLFHYDEFSLKEVYTHELTHLAVEHSEYGNLLIPHSLPFIAYQNQFNKKVFGEETARSLLAWNIVRYSGALEQVKRDNDSLVELNDF